MMMAFPSLRFFLPHKLMEPIRSKSNLQSHGRLSHNHSCRLFPPLAVNSGEGNFSAGHLHVDLMPRHVAVIPDGHNRWAKKNGMPQCAAHQRAFDRITLLSQQCCTFAKFQQFSLPLLKTGVGLKITPYIHKYGRDQRIRWPFFNLPFLFLSSILLARPLEELGSIWSNLEQYLNEELENFMKQGIQLSIIGDFSKLPKSLEKVMADTEEVTKNNTRLQLIFAVNYGGQNDMVQACQSIARKVKDGLIQLEDIDKSLIEQQLLTNCTNLPYPDLLIRTGSELRLSNFLLWQLAYTELFFVQSFFPDFGEAEFLEALYSFQQRKRNFGKRAANI